MAGGWVYIMTNRPNGILYVGVTDNLARRAWQHRSGQVEGFTREYKLTRLVAAEHYEDMLIARQREKKHQALATRLEGPLIHTQNPDWDDLFDQLI